jgi:hypothetical protein
MKPENKFDAVLPMLIKDYDRFRVLDKSLRKNLKDLNIAWLIAPNGQCNSIKKLINDDYYRIIPESIILPELKYYNNINKILHGPVLRGRYFVNKGKCNTQGWYIQQLIKLAMAEKVETDFYLTLDADVVCLRQVGYDDLIQNGKAITNTTKEDVHPEWYEDAERILKIPRSGLTHGVTPAIFNRNAVIELQKYLAQQVHPIFKIISCFSPSNSLLNNMAKSWRSFLIRNTPWTEYSLYNTFLEAMKLFNKYHIDKGAEAIYSRSSSVWLNEQITNFNIDKFIKSEAFFLVFQSTSDIPIEDVWEKIGKHID